METCTMLKHTSEISTLQSIGRGLRKTTTKKELIMVDFFDQSHPFYLIIGVRDFACTSTIIGYERKIWHS